jgi:hypothetical protein
MIDRRIISTAFAACVFLLAADTSKAYMPASSSLKFEAKRSSKIVKNNFFNKPCTSHHISSVVGSTSRVNSRRSTALSVGNWWEDDLPNILGINPFEAALLFGALYKFYGPGVLYEFAREAGKLFSTYAPIVRDLSLDIFNEGKDYLEEDRDRELMRKSGVDVENMPRKTTNIIERFQAGMEAQELAAKGNPDDDTVSTVEKSIAAVSATRSAERLAAKKKSKQLAMAGGDGAPVAEEFSVDAIEGGRIRRKSKKEILIAKDVDIEKVIQGSKDKLNYEENALAKNLNEMQQRFTDFQAAAEARAAGAGSVGSALPLNGPGYSSGGDYYDSDALGGGGYNDMTTFGRMTAAGGGAVAGSALGSQMSAALAESKVLSSSGDYVFPSEYPSDRDGDFPQELGMSSFPSSSRPPNEGVQDTSGMSKFQLQMSGQWNQQVMGKESGAGVPISLDGPNPYAPGAVAAATAGATGAAGGAEPEGVRSQSGFEGGREYGGRESYDRGLGQGSDFEYGDMTDSFTSRRNDNRLGERTRGRGGGRDGMGGMGMDEGRNSGSTYGSNGLPDVPPEWLSVSSDEGLPGSGDIPQDISADDEPLFVPAAMGVGSAAARSVGANEPPLMITGDTAALVVEVLKELDKDYMSLRSRLVSLIEQQAPREAVKVHSVAAAQAGEGVDRDTVAGSDHTGILSEAVSEEDSSSHSTPAEAVTEGVSKPISESSSAVGPRIKYWPSRQLVSN